MGDVTGIEWCDATVNLWIGCTRVSDGCLNCYAAKLGVRFGVTWDAPPKRTTEASWGKLAAYQRGAARYQKKHGRPRRVFINSMSDFFDNQAERGWQTTACLEMEYAPDVVFILVTKRPQNVTRMVPAHWLKAGGWPKNVWLLVTAENQVEYDRRVAHLLALNGPQVAGISMEPMIAPIDPGKSLSHSAVERAGWASKILKRPIPTDKIGSIGWVIIGGESGRGARSMPEADHLVDLARRFALGGAAVFVKQMSAADHPSTYKDPSTFPAGLQMRSFPI